MDQGLPLHAPLPPAPQQQRPPTGPQRSPHRARDERAPQRPDVLARSGEELRDVVVPSEAVKEHLDVTDKKGRWRKHYGEVRAKMGYMPPSECEYLLIVMLTLYAARFLIANHRLRILSPRQGSHQDTRHIACI